MNRNTFIIDYYNAKREGLFILFLSCGAHSIQRPHYRSQNTEEIVSKENQMCHVPTIKESFIVLSFHKNTQT